MARSFFIPAGATTPTVTASGPERDGALSDPRITAGSDDTAEIATDALGIAPVLVARAEDGTIIRAASDPTRAAPSRAALDPAALLQDLTLGFRLGRRTIVRGVDRLLPGEALHAAADGLSIVPATPASVDVPADPDAALDVVAAHTAACAADGALLELSGGIDSRVVLALARHGGTTPRHALTLGTDDAPDVRAARELAEHCGMEHLVIRAEPDPATIADDAVAFVRATGYAVSAASYAWMPALYRRLDAVRTMQLSGVGGERAGGFYDTPFDRASALPGFRALWTRYRLRLPGVDASRVIRPEVVAAHHRAVEGAIRAGLDAHDGPWRERADAFYVAERMRQWAGAALRGAAHWYAVETPMLHPAFAVWARTLRPRGINPRDGLCALIERLDPELAALPYAGDFAVPAAAPRREPKPLRLAKKIARRLRRARKAPELGAAAAVTSLLADPSLADRLDRLVAERDDLFDVRSIDALRAEPARAAHELGFLLTWSIAHDDLRRRERRPAAAAAPDPAHSAAVTP